MRCGGCRIRDSACLRHLAYAPRVGFRISIIGTLQEIVGLVHLLQACGWIEPGIVVRHQVEADPRRRRAIAILPVDVGPAIAIEAVGAVSARGILLGRMKPLARLQPGRDR